MLMSSELHTAVSAGIPAIWIVLNDARYGLVADGMGGLGYANDGLSFAPADLALHARSMGALGLSVSTECQLASTLLRALNAGVPCVVDVLMDPEEKAPVGARNASLADQGGDGR